VLANLFRLDHLATRMRRNAESLLVLAGIKPPRVWRVPVMISDVVRAALSEIENYQRVEILAVETAAVVGSGAADLAHLLAELIENAIAFSPPHQQVEVSGQYQRMGPEAGAFIVTIADAGIGMSPEDVGRANERLAGRESFAVAPSQYLGHYVAGMIARRHGITVRLDSSASRGTTATVTLPPSLLPSPEESSAPVPVTAGLGAYAAPQLPAAPTYAPAPATRGFHPGGRAAVAPSVDTYRVGEAEFSIDFGTLDRSQVPPPGTPARGARVAALTPPAVGPVQGGPVAARGLPSAPAIDTTVIEEAQRARYVRDTLSRFSAGVEKGRDASAHEQGDGVDAAGGTPAPPPG
jgi:hypothetical protein